jgi:dTDP-4-dehydrorhamnose 3,5-epimerase
MQLLPLSIPGAYRVLLDVKFDPRGFFVRTYDQAVFEQNNLVTTWIQESHSFSSKKGTIRGLHFQNPPHSETKLVRAAQGKIFIVLLDIRAESPAFGKWDRAEISIENNELLYVPRGIAMGMCTLTDNCSLLYKMDTEYRPESGRTIRWNDPELGIPWPVEQNPIISDKDRTAPLFREYLKQESIVETR